MAVSALATEPLVCPSGSQVKRETMREGKRAEWCEDVKTAKQNGPARILDTKDTVLLNAEYRQGEVVRHRLTRLGLDKMFAEVNADYAKEGKQFFFTVLDEHNLRFDLVLPGKAPAGDLEEFRQKLLASGPVCKMFFVTGTDFRSMRIHPTNEKKEPLGDLTITRSDCQKPAGG
jgi:hypothetical protein